MQRKIIRYSIWIAVLVLVVVNSVYVKKLSEVKVANSTIDFDASSYAKHYWDEEILLSSPDAIEFSLLMETLQQNSQKAFLEYSHALGIGNIRYFMLQGEGDVVSVNENDISISVKTSVVPSTISIATEFIYGNAVRDAVGAINLNDFPNTMDLNNVSAEINEIIRQKVVPPFKAVVKKGDRVKFVGAIELNQKFLNLEVIEILPVSINIVQQ